MEVNNKIYCPAPGAEGDCPYFNNDGTCALNKPWENCTDFDYYVEDYEVGE